MSNGHTAVNEFLSEKERFADFFNGSLFQGQQIVKPEELEVIKGESDILLEDKEGKVKQVHRYRDIVMRWNQDVYLAILACEVQSRVHYAMPIRKMLYDGLAYLEQAKHVWETRQMKDGEKVSNAEYLSKFHKDDKLVPVITAVFYYGVDIWDGSIDLYGMFQEDEFFRNEVVRKYVPNYEINLIDAERIENVENFQTDLKEIFGLMKYRKDKTALLKYVNEHGDYFRSVDKRTSRAIAGLLQSNKLMKNIVSRKEVEEEDMCKALDDLYEEGIEKGESRKLIALIQKKLDKGFLIERIAEEVEESVEMVQHLIKTHLSNANK